MSYLKKYGLRLFFNVLELLVLLFIVTTIYYFDLINENSYKFIKLLILLGTIFINSFFLGKSSNKKGYIEGIRYGLILITLSFIFTLVMHKFSFKIIIFYLIIMSISIFGSIFGINKKRNN